MNRARTSRALVAVLVLTLGLGVVAYQHSHHTQPPKAAAAIAKIDNAPTPPPLASAQHPAQLAGAHQPPLPQPAAPVVLTSTDEILTTQTPSLPSASQSHSAPAARAAAPAAGPLAATLSPRPVTVAAAAPAAPAVVSSANPLADGKAQLDAGNLLKARRILNDALIAGGLSAADAASAKSLIAQANQTIIFSPRRFSDDPNAIAFTVPPGGALAKIAASHDTTADLLCRINGIPDARKLRAGATIKIIRGPFHAVVNKSAFTMDLYLGQPGGKDSTYVTTFPIGLGKDDSTPTGTWTAGGKLKDPTYYSPRGEGEILAGDPKNPLGKYWISLVGVDGDAVGKSSYGIHGNIDPDSIGKQSSMGCIRMRNEDIPLVYEMLIESKSTIVVKP